MLSGRRKNVEAPWAITEFRTDVCASSVTRTGFPVAFGAIADHSVVGVLSPAFGPGTFWP